MGHRRERQVRGGVPHEVDLLDPAELPDILHEFIVDVVAFNRHDDHRVEHVGAEGITQPSRPSRLGVLVALGGRELPIVVDPASRVPAGRRDRRDGVALDMGAVSDPAEHAPDPEDDDHHRAQAQAEPLAEHQSPRGLAAHSSHGFLGWGRRSRRPRAEQDPQPDFQAILTRARGFSMTVVREDENGATAMPVACGGVAAILRL